MGNKALVIIDVQEGLFNNEESPIYRADYLLQNINKLIEKARKAKIPVVFIRHNSDGLPFESSAWQVHQRLNASGEDIYIEKKYCDSFFETDLQEVLDSKNIKQIVACGLQTEYCVDTFCRSAFSREFKTTLVEDAHSTYNTEILNAKQIIDHHNESLGAAFTQLVSTTAIEF